MKIAYYPEWSYGASSGVFKKIVAQVNQWNRMGHEVAIFNLSAFDIENEWLEALDSGISLFETVWNNRLARLVSIDRVVRDMINWKPQLIYSRYGLYYPSFERFLGTVPLILEINSNNLDEAKVASWQRYQYLKFTRNRLLSRSNGLIFVANQLSTNPNFSKFKILYHVVGNGGDLSIYTPIPAPNNEQPNILFIGTPQMSHHGTDKIINLAKHFSQWKFHLIGPSSNDFSTSLPDNIITYGRMKQQDYSPIVEKVDVAIGSLALHRVGLHEASPLKMAEYLGWGIPVITGYQDTNFMESVEFILELPCSETNVEDSFDQIEAFVYSQMGKRVPREAIQHIDVSHKEKERLEFFESILNSYPK